jgi:hypothetical protein
MNKRCIMRIEVFPQVMEILANATEQVGSTQVSVISRLLEWFVKQSDVTQAAILGLYPTDIQNELPRMIFEQMRAERPRVRNQRERQLIDVRRANRFDLAPINRPITATIKAVGNAAGEDKEFIRPSARLPRQTGRCRVE